MKCLMDERMEGRERERELMMYTHMIESIVTDPPLSLFTRDPYTPTDRQANSFFPCLQTRAGGCDSRQCQGPTTHNCLVIDVLLRV